MLWVLLLSSFLVETLSNPAGQSVLLKNDGSYHFSFDTGDDAGSHAREEVRQPDGTVIGKYSYKDDTGNLRSVSYRAGRQGFIASGDVGAVGSPPAQIPAQIPEIPLEHSEPSTTSPDHDEHTTEEKPATTETPLSSTEVVKENDDEEAHAPPADPNEEEIPSPFAAPPFGKRRLGDDPVKQEDPSSSPVDPSAFFYSYGSGNPYGPQFFSRTPGQASFDKSFTGSHQFYNPSIVKTPNHPFYAPGIGSGMTSHGFYSPGTSAPQAPVWNYIPQQDQPAIKADPHGDQGGFDVPPYWKRRLQDPSEAKEDEEEKIKEDPKEPPIDTTQDRYNSPIYPTLIRTSYIPHAAPEQKKATAVSSPKRKVISRFFIYVPTSQGTSYWGYSPSEEKGNEFKIETPKPEKHAPAAYSPSYQPQVIPHSQFSGPWNYIPQTYMPHDQSPWAYFSRSVPVEKKTPVQQSYIPQHSRPAVQHYSYKGPSNTYGYFYQY